MTIYDYIYESIEHSFRNKKKLLKEEYLKKLNLLSRRENTCSAVCSIS